MQRVHTFFFLIDPVFSSIQRKLWRLGYQTAFFLLLAWLTVLPIDGFLPQTSQMRDISIVLLKMCDVTKP